MSGGAPSIADAGRVRPEESPMTRLLLAFSAAFLLAGSADAAQRTFVSTNGTDASTLCSLASPCRSFGKALTATDADGEIIVLDSGGYGRVTIDRSISIIAPPGIYAGISVFTGTNGIDINTPGVKVALRGLFINGQGGNFGINFLGGAELHIDACTISNMASTGLNAGAGSVYVHDSLIRNGSAQGVFASNTSLQIDRTRVEANASDGLDVTMTAQAQVRDSVIAHNGAGGITVAAGPLTRLDVDNTTISANGQSGVVVSATSPNKAEATISRSTIARNGSTGSFDGVIVDGNNAHLSITDSTVTGNYGEGITAESGATVVVSNNIVTKNALHGFFIVLSTFKSRGNNTVEDNFGGPSSGTITPIGGL